MLRKHGHEVAFAAFWGQQGRAGTWEDFPVFPGSGEDAWARDILPGHYQAFKADLLITLMDVFVLQGAPLQGMNILHWVPVDCSPLSAMDAEALRGSPGRPVAMSRFGEKQLRAAGFDPFYAPHALDMGLWRPLGDRDEGRAKLGITDKFVVGINAANQDPVRKGIAEQVKAFAKFAARHDDARLVIHSRAVTGQGVDLNDLLAKHDLDGKAAIGDQYGIMAGVVTDEHMVTWHGLMDVCSNTAYGEGFGLSILQSQATGTPVVVTGFSAMDELCGAGWRAKGQEWWNRTHKANWRVPFIDSITDCYERAYQKARDPQMREKAHRFALRYDSDRVYEGHWEQILEQADPVKRARRRAETGPRVWDTFMYAGEKDMLEMRCAETRGLVHRHVLTEAQVTHRGVPKPWWWQAEHRAAFGKDAGRVLSIQVRLQPGDPWALEHAQRDQAWHVLDQQADDEDWVLIADVDEIPSPALFAALKTLDVPVASVRMRNCLHAVDWVVPDELVPPTSVVARMGWLRQRAAEGHGLAWVRDHRAYYLEIPDGGWHFSWMGGPEAATRKLDERTCHTEMLGSPEEDAIRSGERWRTGADGGALPVKAADVDETWPAWIRDRKCPPSWFRPRELAAEVVV